MKYPILIMLLILFSCKKDDEPATTSSGSGTPAVSSKQASMKINDTLFACDVCTNTYFSGGIHGVNIAEAGTTNRLIFNFDTLPSVGTHTLIKYGDVSLTYEKNGYYYRGRGLINITSISTGTSGAIKQFKATFDALTDTASNNRHFKITEGSINFGQ